jgi:hypothetical protein
MHETLKLDEKDFFGVIDIQIWKAFSCCERAGECSTVDATAAAYAGCEPRLAAAAAAVAAEKRDGRGAAARTVGDGRSMSSVLTQLLCLK